MKYDFDTLIDRQSTESVKWNYYPKDVLPMWVADMDFVSPEPVTRALHQRVDHGVFGYPEGGESSPRANQHLREAIVQRMADRYHWQVNFEAVVIIPGIVTGLNLATQTCVPQDHGVLVQTPVYPPFLALAANAGVVDQRMELTRSADGAYSVDWDAFESAITPQTRMFVLCNPHNPIGRVFRRSELERFAEICQRHDLWIVSDEIHCDLLFSGHQHIPFASLDSELARKTITFLAPSKTFNLAGLECSIAIIPDRDLRKKFLHAGRGVSGFVNLMGLVAAEAAYDEGQEWLSQLLVYLEGNRDVLYDFVRQELPGINMVKPDGTYLAWLDCRSAGLEDPARFFLDKARVGMNDGKTFGKGGEGFVRLNFGCPRSMLLQALERMKNALK